MFGIQKALANVNRFPLSRLLCLVPCNGHKYLHSASREIRRYKLSCLKDFDPFYLNSSTFNKIETVKLSVTTQTPQMTQIQPLDLSRSLYASKKKIELPVASIVVNFRLPPVRDIVESTYEPKHYIEAPAQGGLIDKQAARLIVIRRRKMKKHQLRKLRIKMKFEWAKVRQRREMRKEKAFQAQLIAQIKETEKFDAEKYVAERLQEAHKVPLPRTWKGK